MSPGLAAAMLGRVGDPLGYETVREILFSECESLAEKYYAAIAMARILGSDADERTVFKIVLPLRGDEVTATP